MTVSNIRFTVQHGHYPMQWLNCGADVPCPHCDERHGDTFLLSFVLIGEKERDLHAKLTNRKPWTCQGCGVVFGLSAKAKATIVGACLAMQQSPNSES